MIDYHIIDNVFGFNPQYRYDSSEVEIIETNRRALEGLFVDKVLRAMEIKRPAKFYPPKSNSDLRALHQVITAANGPDHMKLSILYYVLLDCDLMTKSNSNSDSFERSFSLPKEYQICMKGFWHMDHLDFEIAVQYLTHPSLIPTYPDEVLQALVQHSKHDDFTLPLAYYYTVQPALKTSHTIESLFTAIGRTNLVEAFYFCRVQTDVTRRKMFETLISIVLHSPAGERTATRGIELVNLPFTQEEEQWFEEYLTKGEGRGFKKAKDTLMIRRIGTGKFSEAISLSFEGGRISGGLSWEMLQNGLQEGLGPRADA